MGFVGECGCSCCWRSSSCGAASRQGLELRKSFYRMHRRVVVVCAATMLCDMQWSRPKRSLSSTRKAQSKKDSKLPSTAAVLYSEACVAGGLQQQQLNCAPQTPHTFKLACTLPWQSKGSTCSSGEGGSHVMSSRCGQKRGEPYLGLIVKINLTAWVTD